MPKVDIDYSNTIIYKITCKNPNITDVYVGHTTNFVQRKCAHKQNCIKEQCKLYTTIRNNGGWVNWTMEIINFFNCKDHYEARLKEQEYFELLHATLNSIQPMPKPKSKPIKEVKNNETSNLFACECCDYTTGFSKDYTKHLLTSKHQILQNTINNPTSNIVNSKTYLCNCGKQYKHSSSLYAHKTKCAFIHKSDPIPEKEEPTNKELLTMILQSNLDIKQLLIQLVKNP
jgi:hypothetical protein